MGIRLHIVLSCQYHVMCSMLPLYVTAVPDNIAAAELELLQMQGPTNETILVVNNNNLRKGELLLQLAMDNYG